MESCLWARCLDLYCTFLRASTLYMSSYFRYLEEYPICVDGFWRLSWCLGKIPVDACLMCAWGFRRHISSCGCQHYTFVDFGLHFLRRKDGQKGSGCTGI